MRNAVLCLTIAVLTGCGSDLGTSKPTATAESARIANSVAVDSGPGVLTDSTDRNPPSPAWEWVRFSPTDTTIYGLNVKQIDPTWAKALRLSRTTVRRAIGDSSMVTDHQAAFVQEGDFNLDNIPDRAVVGVFENQVGQRGRFLMILTLQSGKWTKVFLDQEFGEDAVVTMRMVQKDPPILLLFKGNDPNARWSLRWYQGRYQRLIMVNL